MDGSRGWTEEKWYFEERKNCLREGRVKREELERWTRRRERCARRLRRGRRVRAAKSTKRSTSKSSENRNLMEPCLNQLSWTEPARQ